MGSTEIYVGKDIDGVYGKGVVRFDKDGSLSLTGRVGYDASLWGTGQNVGYEAGIKYSPQDGFEFVFKDDIGLSLGVPGLSFDPANGVKDFSIDIGAFGVLHELDPATQYYSGEIKFEVVGSTLVPVEINGKEIPNSVDKVYVQHDVFAGGYISFNKDTLDPINEFKSDLVHGVDPYQARQTLFDKLISLQRSGITAFRSDPPPHVIGSAGQTVSGSLCFGPGTLIELSNGDTVPIENIRLGDTVAAFSADGSINSPLEAGVVSAIYRNKSTEIYQLDFSDGRHKVFVTPDHLFLTTDGTFRPLRVLVAGASGRINLVDRSGSHLEASATLLTYGVDGGSVLDAAGQPDGSDDDETKLGWSTYNFEVDKLHTYVAGGIRVHNHSGALGDWANRTDSEIDAALGIREGGFLDKLTDIVTSPIHAAGQFIDGIARAGTALGQGFETARDLFERGDLVGAIGSVAGGIVDAVGEVAAGIGRAVGEVVGDIAEAVGSAIEGIGRAISGFVDSALGHDSAHDGRGSDSGKPVVIDLDGDGVEVNINGDVSFDMDADGYKERTAWADADDGFLVVDFAASGRISDVGDGQITQSKELVLTEILGLDEITDLQALAIMEKTAAYGGNNDGALNSRDALWQKLKIWQDQDQDGEVDVGEMKTLDKFGIKQINLKYDDSTAYSNFENDVGIFGNTLLGSASYIKTDGTVVEGGVGDVSLSYSAVGWRRVETPAGYEIQFEAGRKVSIAELEGKSSPNVNLDAEALDGAVGDVRANVLSAAGHSRSVQITGGAGDDVLTGGENDDMLSGDAGADQLRGMGGNDLLFLDAADLAAGKTITGDAGLDIARATGATGISLKLADHTLEGAYGSEGHDRLDGSGLSDDLPILGGKGNDTVIGGEGDDNLTGDDGVDLILGGNGDDRLSGGNQNDTLNGNAGTDVLSGGAGNDNLDGGVGDDILLGGAGEDSLNGSSDDDRIDGDDGNDTLDGQEGDDILTGGKGDDRLTFWWGDDQLAGEEGNDTFVMTRGDLNRGFWGWSVLQGGMGSDTLILDGAQSAWNIRRVDGTPNQWTLYRSESNGGNVMVISAQDIERVQFANGATLALSVDTTLDTSDRYKRTGWNIYNGDSTADHDDPQYRVGETFNGYMGNDSLNARDSAPYIHGGDFTDFLIPDLIDGSTGNDTILAGGGNDTIQGNFGTDAIAGDEGNDQITGGSGSDQISGGAGNDVIFGNSGSDLLSGDDGADWIDGQDGSDVVSGGAGQDTLIGGTGSDLIQGGADDDTLKGGTGVDRLYGEAGNDRLEGEAGTDVLSGGTGNDSLFGGDGLNILSGDGGDDLLTGGADDDMLTGGAGNDTLNGGAEGDTLIGGAGADILDGGAGILDLVSYEGSASRVIIDLEVISGTETIQSASGGEAQGDTLRGIERVFGSAHDDILTGSGIDNVLNGAIGNDRLIGMAGHDDLVGGDGDDTLSAGDGDDRVWGDAGDDSILGWWGQDTIYGGSGYDVIDYSASGTASYINLQTNQHTGVAAGQMIYQVENVVGTQGYDTLRGNAGANLLDGHDGNDTLIGGLGADTLDGGTGGDTASYEFATAGIVADLQFPGLNTGEAANDVYQSIEHLRGSDFNDTLRGGAGANWLHGGEGSDLLDGCAGNDALVGEDGDDTILGGTGADSIYGGEGTDRIQYSTSANRIVVDMQKAGDNQGDALGDVFSSIEGIFGSTFDDWILGNDVSETLWGHTGDDHLYGRDGDDKLVGGDGDDTLDGGLGRNTAVYEGTAAVSVNLANGNSTGGQGNDILVNIDHLITGAGSDSLTGSIDANCLNGGAGNDTISAWGGSDRITGGAGTDLMRGGVGDGVLDTFVFVAITDSAVGTARDTIEDFVSGIDRIDLGALDANATAAGAQSFLFGGTTARANAIWYVGAADGIIVRADVNGNATADFEFLLRGVTIVTGADFVL